MILSEQAFNELLPPYLHEVEKGRIRSALSQFTEEGEINYSNFYTTNGPQYLMQADILSSVKGIMWDEQTGDVQNGYNPAMLISNSCDVSSENTRSLNQKDVLFAPIIPLEEYIADCEAAGTTQGQLTSFINVLKRQEHTNIFYLPPNPKNSREYLVRFDRIYWLPIYHLTDSIADVPQSRFISLSTWAWYLFIVKLSLHTCRVPETVERPQFVPE